MIKIDNLTKSFKIKSSKKGKKKDKIIAVDHLTFKIKKGENFGIIGPNGAGKTTFLKILSTLILPDEGTATIDGYDVVKDSEIVKTKVGLLAGEFVRSFYWRLSGRNNLKFFANLRNIWNPDEKIDELIELFDLKKHENELVMKYSTGMKHKLALAMGLLDDPPVIFLDEPLTGIDPLTSFEIKNLIKDKFKEKTIIWTSHNLFEMEEMCDRIALLKDGSFLLQGKPNDLKKEYWKYEKIMVSAQDISAFSSIDKSEIIPYKNIAIIETNDFNKTLESIMKISKEKKIQIDDIKTMKPSLEEIFMKVIKND